MSLKHDVHNRSHFDFEIHVKITGVNRAWGKSTTPIPDFPQALFTRVNIPAKGHAHPATGTGAAISVTFFMTGAVFTSFFVDAFSAFVSGLLS